MNETQGIARYQEFLVARDGDADLLRHRLSKRELFFDNLERNPVRSYAPIDRAAYFRNIAKRRSEPGLEPRMLFIVATAKVNQAERFGVGLTKLLGRVNAGRPRARPRSAPGDLPHPHAGRDCRYVWPAGARTSAARISAAYDPPDG
jgi:hypothetical protein